jgi:hypothetical protein
MSARTFELVSVEIFVLWGFIMGLIVGGIAVALLFYYHSRELKRERKNRHAIGRHLAHAYRAYTHLQEERATRT